MKTLVGGTLIISAILLTVSCSSVYEKVYPTLHDGQYDSEFPYNNSSEQLEKISRSIKLLNSIAFYTGYIFDANSNLTVADVKKIDPEKNAIEKVYFNRSASGTATMIYSDNEKIALLSVAHIVNFPDTIISYFINSDGSFSQYVQSISIKSNQSNYIPDLPHGGQLDIVAIDKVQDIALVGMKVNATEALSLPKFDYPWGKSAELEWGSFVYVFGFPMNYKMISKGIVSKTNSDKNLFLIDAVFNRGYSGGIVLAIRDGVPNFELVGLVKSAPAEYEYTIRPLTKEHDIDYNPMIPYKGDLYVDKQQSLKFGITKVLGIEAVEDFLKKNKEYLLNQGYYLDQFKSSTTILKSSK